MAFLALGQGGEDRTQLLLPTPPGQLLQEPLLRLEAFQQVHGTVPGSGRGHALARPDPQQSPQAGDLVLLLLQQPQPSAAPAGKLAVGSPELPLPDQTVPQLLGPVRPPDPLPDPALLQFFHWIIPFPERICSISRKNR